MLKKHTQLLALTVPSPAVLFVPIKVDLISEKFVLSLPSLGKKDHIMYQGLHNKINLQQVINFSEKNFMLSFSCIRCLKK